MFCFRLVVNLFVFSFMVYPVSFGQGFTHPVNDPNYPVPQVTLGQDLLIEAEDARLDFAPLDQGGKAVEDVYTVVENEKARNGKVVLFKLADAGGRFTNWSLTFPFELTEKSRVRILLRLRFFNADGAKEGKGYVKMDNNEYDVWPEDFLGFNEVWGMDFPGKPEYDGGGWIQINHFSNRQRKANTTAWGANTDFRTFWCEGNWYGLTPDVDILEWELPKGIHTFKMTPRSGGSMELDWLVITTSEFDRETFIYEPSPYVGVKNFMLY